MRINWAWVADRLHRLIRNHPYAIVAAALCLAALSFAYTRGHLEFWTERNVLISQKSPSAMLYGEYRKEFKDDYVILVLRSKDLEQAKRFASDLGKRMEADRDTIQEVFYRIPMETFRRQALLFLDPQEIEDLHTKIEKHQDLLQRLASSPGLLTLLRTINEQISRALVRTAISGLFSEEDGKGREEEKARVDPEDLRLMSSLMDSLYTWLTDPPRYRSPWGVFMQDPGGMSEDGYLIDEERGWLFMMAYLKDLEGSFNREGAAIERIREHIGEVSARVPDVNVAITGTPALNSDEMASSFEDMTRAMGLALLLVTVLFVIGFGEARRPLAAVLALLLGIVWALGWLSLTVGHLTILSMAFGSILVGLGIDFGIHLVARYEKERNSGQDPSTALGTALHRVGRAIFSGAITTAAAFFALGFSSFRGIKEFGWIAGSGILCCFVAELFFLPVLLLWLDRKSGGHLKTEGRKKAGRPRLERVLGWPARHPGWVVPVAGCMAVVAVLPWAKVRFDYNLLHLQPKGTEAVEWELKLLEAQGDASIFAAVLVDSLEEARERAGQYEELSLVNKVESLADYVPTDPEERMDRILELAPLFEEVELETERPSTPSLKQVGRWIAKIRFKLREEEKEESGGRVLTKTGTLPPPDTVSGASLRTERVLRLLEADETQGKDFALGKYQERLFIDFRRKIELIMASLDPVPITVEGLPELLKKRFIGTSGRLVLQIYPKEDIWELGPQRRFVEQLASVNPEVTGTAVQNYDATKSLLDAYIQGGLYAVCAIILILFVDFRHPVLVLLTLLPLLFGGLWTLLGMKVLKMAFNPANLVIIPLLVGIGVDNGIHVIRHFLGSRSSDDEIAGSSTGRAITISTLTTMAGFGSLMIARHQGIHSVGTLLTLAMASCLLASLVVLPSLLLILPEGVRHRIWCMGQPKQPDP
jgi:hopanoid biosynthesis associated RND transporter like protein HpnN